MFKIRKWALAATTGAAFAVALASPAFAEGSFNSFMEDVQVGFLSRVWTDNDLDSTSTSIRFTGCNPSVIHIAIYRQDPFIDPKIGSNQNPCSGRKFWGDLGAADYRFKVESIENSQFADVSSLNVQY